MNFIRKFIYLTNKKFDYVFFSEGRYYQTYFDEFIKLIARNINNDLIYLSSDKNDVINEKNIRNIYIGNGFLRLFYLSVIKCKYFFMTLTDLNNHNIRRSKNIFVTITFYNISYFFTICCNKYFNIFNLTTNIGNMDYHFFP